ncbi:MFS transporter [Mycolicibacterium mucogenicum]|uniref:MFS transporter n=1 Tax=Mycolicibacterium mucogenicum TaxID=56689 RepID=UPI00226ACEE3|nr:MFS transporter [Mycolicibacterium mucogenicum]MCX8560321.1 MFS transporter [Mycolicibacterium mucogenicum]
MPSKTFPSKSRQPALPVRRHTDWRALLACCAATFLLLVYTTVVTVSVSAIADELGAGFTASQWIVDVYTLVLAALVLAMGTLGDRVGHRRLFLTGLVAFGGASLACALVGSGGLLISARAAQGVGGAAIFATAVPLLAQSYTGRARGIAFAVWGAVAGAGSAVGTLAGGAVTEFLSWRWLFVAAVPVCGFAVVLGAVALPREHHRSGRVDLVGTALVTTAMTAVTYAMINAGEHGWASTGTVVGAATGVSAAWAFVLVQRCVRDPVLPAGLFVTRGFTGALLAAFAYYFAAFAPLPVLSRWLQGTAGMAPLQAGFILTIQLAAFIAVSLTCSARLHDAPRSWVLGAGTMLTGLACLSGWAVVVRPQWTTLIAALVVTGIGAGAISPVLPAVAATSVPPTRAGSAAAAANAARQLGLTIGVALCGAVAQAGGTGADTTTSGLAAALIVAGLAAICGGAVSFVLLRAADRAVSDRA